jgi:two-component system, NarL family, nitrate/nitrite response regulator NarL
MRDRSSMRLLVVDDHPVFRMGLVAALRSIGFGLVEEAEDGVVALSRVRDQTYDIVVTDLKMPGASGIEVAQALARSSPTLPVVLLTTFNEPAVVDIAERSGVRAVLSKEIEPSALGRVIDDVVSGAQRSTRAPDLPDFTSRERDVLDQLLQGLSVKEIAVKLDVATATVKDHVANLYAKLEVRDRVGFVLAARRLGFTTLQDLSPDDR